MLTPEQTKQRLQKIKQISIDNKIKQDKLIKDKAENAAIASLLLITAIACLSKPKKKWYQF